MNQKQGKLFNEIINHPKMFVPNPNETPDDLAELIQQFVEEINLEEGFDLDDVHGTKVLNKYIVEYVEYAKKMGMFDE